MHAHKQACLHALDAQCDSLRTGRVTDRLCYEGLRMITICCEEGENPENTHSALRAGLCSVSVCVSSILYKKTVQISLQLSVGLEARKCVRVCVRA